MLYRALLYIHNYASAIFARHTSVSFRAFSNQSGRIIFTEELTEPSHVSKANEIEIFQRRIGWRFGPMTVLAIRQTCEPSVVGARACTSHTRMYLSFPTAYSSRSNLYAYCMYTPTMARPLPGTCRSCKFCASMIVTAGTPLVLICYMRA